MRRGQADQRSFSPNTAHVVAQKTQLTSATILLRRKRKGDFDKDMNMKVYDVDMQLDLSSESDNVYVNNDEYDGLNGLTASAVEKQKVMRSISFAGH